MLEKKIDIRTDIHVHPITIQWPSFRAQLFCFFPPYFIFLDLMFDFFGGSYNILFIYENKSISEPDNEIF